MVWAYIVAVIAVGVLFWMTRATRQERPPAVRPVNVQEALERLSARADYEAAYNRKLRRILRFFGPFAIAVGLLVVQVKHEADERAKASRRNKEAICAMAQALVDGAVADAPPDNPEVAKFKANVNDKLKPLGCAIR